MESEYDDLKSALACGISWDVYRRTVEEAFLTVPSHVQGVKNKIGQAFMFFTVMFLQNQEVVNCGAKGGIEGVQ